VTLNLGASLAGTGLAPGRYAFDADGKMIIPETPVEPEVKNGVINDFLYIDGVMQTAYKLVLFEGDYYYISDGHKIARNVTLNLGASLAGTGLTPGKYSFDADGKMILPD
jgi:hypothetical protein